MLLMGMPGLPEWIILITLTIIVIVIVRVVRKKSRQGLSQSQQTNVNINNTSITSELEKLSLLKDKGVITQEEFEEQKKKLLNS